MHTARQNSNSADHQAKEHWCKGLSLLFPTKPMWNRNSPELLSTFRVQADGQTKLKWTTFNPSLSQRGRQQKEKVRVSIVNDPYILNIYIQNGFFQWLQEDLCDSSYTEIWRVERSIPQSLRMEYFKVPNTTASKDAETFPMHQQNIRSGNKTAKRHFSPKENEVLKYLPHISLNSLKDIPMKVWTPPVCANPPVFPVSHLGFRQEHLITSCVCWEGDVQAIHLQWVSFLGPERRK